MQEIVAIAFQAYAGLNYHQHFRVERGSQIEIIKEPS